MDRERVLGDLERKIFEEERVDNMSEWSKVRGRRLNVIAELKETYKHLPEEHPRLAMARACILILEELVHCGGQQNITEVLMCATVGWGALGWTIIEGPGHVPEIKTFGIPCKEVIKFVSYVSQA